MELLFGRFPHLVEDIFGLLNVKTLSCCSQINEVWRINVEEYRLYLVKKVQKRLRNQNIVYGSVADSEKEKDQLLPAILSETGETSSISKWPTRIMIGDSTIPERNITVEELALPFLVKLLKYFGDYKLKNSEVNFRIILHQNTSVLVGMFVKNKANGMERMEDMEMSQKVLEKIDHLGCKIAHRLSGVGVYDNLFVFQNFR